MKKVTPIETKSRGSEFDEVYHDLQTAIGDAKAVADLLSSVDAHLCDINAVGYALWRMLKRAEGICSKVWEFHPGHSK